MLVNTLAQLATVSLPAHPHPKTESLGVKRARETSVPTCPGVVGPSSISTASSGASRLSVSRWASNAVSPRSSAVGVLPELGARTSSGEHVLMPLLTLTFRTDRKVLRMSNIKRPLPFILVSSNHGTMIMNRNDYCLDGAGEGWGCGLSASEYRQSRSSGG